MKKVLIITGSKSDYPLLEELTKLFDDSGIEFGLRTASCHRDLDGLHKLLNELKADESYGAIIAVANAVSNMPSIVASYLIDTDITVIGVGLDNKGMRGIDSLLSINTIPKGVPLANTGIGDVGLYNAGLLAIQILKSK
jgi:5-(carboxyamino)imidazole ribonucleotide mutase